MALETAKVVALADSPDHGDINVRPRPEPTSMRMSVNVEAAKAPAMIGAQLTAGTDDSAGVETSASTDGAMAASYRMKSINRIMIGIGTPSSQSRIPRPIDVPP
jgi:hypothetical protein